LREPWQTFIEAEVTVPSLSFNQQLHADLRPALEAAVRGKKFSKAPPAADHSDLVVAVTKAAGSRAAEVMRALDGVQENGRLDMTGTPFSQLSVTERNDLLSSSAFWKLARRCAQRGGLDGVHDVLLPDGLKSSTVKAVIHNLRGQQTFHIDLGTVSGAWDLSGLRNLRHVSVKCPKDRYLQLTVPNGVTVQNKGEGQVTAYHPKAAPPSVAPKRAGAASPKPSVVPSLAKTAAEHADVFAVYLHDRFGVAGPDVLKALKGKRDGAHLAVEKLLSAGRSSVSYAQVLKDFERYVARAKSDEIAFMENVARKKIDAANRGTAAALPGQAYNVHGMAKLAEEDLVPREFTRSQLDALQMNALEVQFAAGVDGVDAFAFNEFVFLKAKAMVDAGKMAKVELIHYLPNHLKSCQAFIENAKANQRASDEMLARVVAEAQQNMFQLAKEHLLPLPTWMANWPSAARSSADAS
jgi:hypothetical protein